MSTEFSNLLIDFWHDLQQPDVLRQIGVLLLCMALAFGADRFLRHRKPVDAAAPDAWRIGQGGLQRVAFPLVALLLVYAARQWLQHAMHTNLLALAIPLFSSLAIIRTVFYVLRHSFGSSSWLAPFERGFALTVWSVVALHILGLLPELIELLESVSLPVGKQRLDLWMLLQAAATLLVTLLIAIWFGGLVEARLARSSGLDANLRVVFARISRALLLVLAILIGLPLVGIDLTTLSVFGGAFGVGIAFGLQKIASNYVSGFIILLDRSIRLGNMISVGNERGQVTQITTRYTVLKSLTGVEAIVPNEVLIGSVVLNESLNDPRMRLALPIQVAYGADLERAMQILVAAAQAQPRVLTDPPAKAFVLAFADSGINLELGFWIKDSQEGSQQLRSDINLQIWRDFQAAGIEIPFPQREVRVLGAS